MEWETIIGLETHAELATQSKIFCGCSTAFGAPPNTQCCPVCMGLPGALPVLNARAVELAVIAGLALHCQITPRCRFDRKNYFYPDLPKAYQISQLYLPLCRDGWVEAAGRHVRIREIHMEEDAGKLLHDPAGGTTRVDYNRCGVPLIEIVTMPDFRTGTEAVAYLEQLRSTLQYLGVSDGKMQEGSLRCDVNLSVRPVGQAELGVRTELKNLSSFRAVAKAIAYESARQIALLQAGGRVVQETRRWDEVTERTLSMRSKEEAKDYRYFPEPDLPPLELNPAWLAQLRDSLPELAHQKLTRYQSQWGVSAEEARTLTAQRPLAEFFEAVVALGAPAQQAAHWMTGPVLAQLSSRGLSPEAMFLEPRALARLIALVVAGALNRATAVQVLEAVLDSEADVDEYIRAHQLEQISDQTVVDEAAAHVLAEYPKSVSDYRSGKEKALGFLVGQTMRALQGKADPALVRRTLLQQLDQLP